MRIQIKKNKQAFRLLTCLILALMPELVSGQQAAVDSLKNLLEKQDLSVDKKLEIYDALVFSHWEHDAQKGVEYGQKGIALAKKHNDKKWLTILYCHTAMCFHFLTQYDSAHIYQDQAFEPGATLEELTPLANAHMNKGSIFKMQTKYPEALEEYFKALQLFEKENHEKGKGMASQNIGLVYLLLRNNEQAIKYLKDAEAIAVKLNDMENLGAVLIAFTNIYRETDIPKALDNAKRAVDIYHKMGNKYAEAVALSVLGRCHEENEDYQQAAVYTERGLEIAKEIGYPNLVAQLYVNLSNVRYYQARYAESEELAFEGHRQDTSNIEIKHNVLYNHIRNNMHLGEFKKAEEYINEYYESVTHFATTEYQSSLSETEVKYETEKKELKIAALEKQRRLYSWLGIAAGIILLISLAIAVLRYRLAVSKRKLAEEEAHRTEQEKQLVAVQATLDGEAAERTRLAKDLHDGLGSMLSVVKLNLPQMKSGTVVGTIDVPRFQKALGMLDDSIQELRRVAHHMMPESLMRYGLKASLSDFCEAIPGVVFHYFGSEGRLPEQTETLIYRCIHELVNNALKHAEANQINVQLVQEIDRLSFTVQDDGIGFDEKAAEEGMGLRNVRQRIAAFQGKMNIYSSDKGTEINVELELTKDNGHD